MKPYLKYLFEVLAIVVGITLSFMVDEWRDEKKKREDERELLREFGTTMNADIDDLEFRRDWFLKQIAYLDTLHDMLQEDNADPRLGKIVGKTFHTTMFFPQKGVYEDLKQRGISLLKNETIKSRLVTHYETTINILDLQGDHYIKNFSNELVAYSFKNFDKFGPVTSDDSFDVWETDAMIPNDYSRFRNDPEFRSMLNTYENLLSIQVTACNKIIASARACTELIDEYLNGDN